MVLDFENGTDDPLEKLKQFPSMLALLCTAMVIALLLHQADMSFFAQASTVFIVVRKKSAPLFLFLFASSEATRPKF